MAQEMFATTTVDGMRAISIKQPWAWAIVHGLKDIENRTWRLPDRFKGQNVLVHAGLKADTAQQFGRDARSFIEETSGHLVPPLERLPMGALVGVCRFEDSVNLEGTQTDASSALHRRVSASPWAFGPWCWTVSYAVPLQETVPCKGRLSFWVPSEVQGVPLYFYGEE